MEKGEGCRKNYALTNRGVGRRDQHAACSFHGLPVVPFYRTTTPVPLRKPRARHDLTIVGPQAVASFRLRFGDGRYAPAALR
jgi:hypothetical protein